MLCINEPQCVSVNINKSCLKYLMITSFRGVWHYTQEYRQVTNYNHHWATGKHQNKTSSLLTLQSSEVKRYGSCIDTHMCNIQLRAEK